MSLGQESRGGGNKSWGRWDYSSVVECVFSMHKTHGSTPSTTFKNFFLLKDGNMTHKREWLLRLVPSGAEHSWGRGPVQAFITLATGERKADWHHLGMGLIAGF